MPSPLPPNGRLAGIDYGHVRVGVAISDPAQTIASPLETYTRRNAAADAGHFRWLANEEQIVGFVVGLPVHASGDESEKSGEARRFGHWLSEVTGQPVCFQDERYTTVQAEQILTRADLRGRKRKIRRDMLAAQIILSAYLDSPRSDDRGPAPLED